MTVGRSSPVWEEGKPESCERGSKTIDLRLAGIAWQRWGEHSIGAQQSQDVFRKRQSRGRIVVSGIDEHPPDPLGLAEWCSLAGTSTRCGVTVSHLVSGESLIELVVGRTGFLIEEVAQHSS
jgi:hypothetical protein